MLEAIAPYIATPAFASFVLGFAVPGTYSWLTSVGVEVPSKWKVWLNAGLCAVVSIVPLALVWASAGVPTPEDFFKGLTAAFIASSMWYETMKPRETI